MSASIQATNHEVRDTAGSYVLAEAGSEVLPAGYKRTEVGVIPEEWQVQELADLKPFITSGSRGWADYYSNRGSAFIRITNMSRDSIYLDLDDLKLVNLPPDATEGVRTQLQDGDLLVSITADIGIIAFVDPSVPKPAYINQHIALVRLDAEKADSKFLSYFLAGESSQKAFRAGTDQGAKAGMNLPSVRKIKAVFPPLVEQRAIATALSDVDALLAKLDQLIAKKRDIKQAAMQQLLTGNTRLPGFTEKWKSKRLCEVAIIQPGINKPLSEMGAGALYVTVQDVYNEVSIDVSTLGRIRVSPSELDAKELVSGDIVFGKSSVKREGIGHPNIFLGCAERVVFSGFAYRARALPGLADAKYLFYSLKSTPTRRWLVDNSQASALTNINKSISDAIPVVTPPIDEQTAIATILSDMDTELAALEARRDKTGELKQGMMQALLTGRIRMV